MKILRCRDKQLQLDFPQVMGVLNITPDSFYDGGYFLNPTKAIERGLEIIAEGASILDIGGESVRPGAASISVQEELDRVLPVLQGIRKETNAIISIDTSKPEVMEQCILYGADLINDITALQDPASVKIVAKHQVAVCLMHMQGSPATMQHNPTYSNLLAVIKDFFQERIDYCVENGVQRDCILLDPGFGFGKTTTHNLQLLKYLQSFQELGQPILAGLSRKFSIGEILNKPVDQRLYGSIAAHVIAVLNGANIVRVHDIKPTVDALNITSAVLQE